MARVKQAQGDLDSAFDLLDKAERLNFNTPVPDVNPQKALKTRMWISQGNMAEALDWVREQDLSVDDGISYLREFEHITLARVLIALYMTKRVDESINDSLGLLDRLLQAAEEGKRTGSVIEILVLQALAHAAQGDISAALVPLERALTLAEPEGYVRIFVDEGQPMAKLLNEVTKRGILSVYSRKLLAAFDHEKATVSPNQSGNLVEPLSERELEVLQLIAQGLTNREIGERLFLALDTVKGHNRRVFGKLGVQNRTEAVTRARELELL
jgi:LuxR family maltose regulon positive regulatory protein